MNYVSNPRFNQTSGWDLINNAAFTASSGKTQLGAVSLGAAGDAVRQSFGVGYAPDFELYAWFYDVVGGGQIDVALTNQHNQTVYSETVTVTATATWEQWAQTLQLPPAAYQLAFTYNNATILVDEVSVAHVPTTRYQLATNAHTRVQSLVSPISTWTAPSGGSNEGSYETAVTQALRRYGAVNAWDEVDLRHLAPVDVEGVVDMVEEIVLTGEILNYYTKVTDTQLGARRESFSQIARGIRERYNLVPGATSQRGQFAQLNMRHP